MNDLAWLSIIGINENGIGGLSLEAKKYLSEATLVVGGKRHLALAASLIKNKTLDWPSPPHDAIKIILAKRPEKICVLCSGDPFFYGMGAVLACHIPMSEIEVFPAPSIASLVAARLGWALQHTTTIAVNGRPVERLIPHLQPGAKLIALSADETTPQAIASLLTRNGFADVDMTILEHVGGPQERIRRVKAEEFALTDIARLNCVAIDIAAEPKRGIPITSGLEDHWFEHDGQMTKREIRAVTLSALTMRRGELLWDIGLGSGSVAIEWLLRDPANRAIGFEKDATRASRAAANAKMLGVPQLVVLEGMAPDVCEGLEAPDAIFIGGGAAMPGMIEFCLSQLKTGGRLVINAVSLETENLLLAAYKKYGGTLIRIGIERADAISETMTGWRPAMTVMQWSISK